MDLCFSAVMSVFEVLTRLLTPSNRNKSFLCGVCRLHVRLLNITDPT